MDTIIGIIGFKIFMTPIFLNDILDDLVTLSIIFDAPNADAPIAANDDIVATMSPSASVLSEYFCDFSSTLLNILNTFL